MLKIILKLFLISVAAFSAAILTNSPLFAMNDEPLILRGDLLLSEVNSSIFVVVDEMGPNGRTDGDAERAFILQRTSTAPKAIDLPTRVFDAVVYFDHHRLLIHAPDLRRDVVLTIDDRVDGDLRFGNDTFDVHGEDAARLVYHGVGLAHGQGTGHSVHETLRTIESRAPALADAVAAGAKFCPDGGGGGSVDCWSGGCGATSCSGNCVITPSCGISCSDGYFACCGCDFWGPTGCKCYSNEECGC